MYNILYILKFMCRSTDKTVFKSPVHENELLVYFYSSICVGVEVR